MDGRETGQRQPVAGEVHEPRWGPRLDTQRTSRLSMSRVSGTSRVRCIGGTGASEAGVRSCRGKAVGYLCTEGVAEE